MTSAGRAAHTARAPSSFAARLVRTGITIGVVDALWAVVLTVAYGRTITALWQGVASVPFGKAVLEGGVATAWLGLGVHFCVAFTWSAVFLFAHAQSAALRRLVSTGAGVAVASVIYGPLIWTLMSLVFIPLRTGNPAPAITARWMVQLVGHAFFVGLPIVWSAVQGSR